MLYITYEGNFIKKMPWLHESGSFLNWYCIWNHSVEIRCFFLNNWKIIKNMLYYKWRKLHKKRIRLIAWIRRNPVGWHLKSTKLKSDVFIFYLKNKIYISINIIINRRSIMKNRDFSLLVIIPPPFLLKGKHLTYFKRIHKHYTKHIFIYQQYILKCW